VVGYREAANRIDELTDECVDFLSRICAIPALGPDNQGAGEAEKYRVIRDAVLSMGPDQAVELSAADHRVPEGIRPNLLALFEGRDRARTL